MSVFDLPSIPSVSEGVMDSIIGKVRLMESSLKSDQRLSVVCYTGQGEPIEVARLQFTDTMVIVVHGYDSTETPTYVVSSVFALQLVCRIIKVESSEKNEKKKNPIGFEFSGSKPSAPVPE